MNAESPERSSKYSVYSHLTYFKQYFLDFWSTILLCVHLQNSLLPPPALI